MRKTLSILLFAVTFAALAMAAPKPVNILPVSYFGQDEDLWCWAASDEMVMDYFNKHIKQCKEVTKVFQIASPGCCVHPRPKDCLQGFGISIEKFGFEVLGGDLNSWEAITTEIDAMRPFESVWMYFSNPRERARKKRLLRQAPVPEAFAHRIGHNTVAYGYVNLPALKFVLVHDPLYDDKWVYPEKSFASGPDYQRSDYSRIQRAKK